MQGNQARRKRRTVTVMQIPLTGDRAVSSLRIFTLALTEDASRNLILLVMRWFARDTWPVFGLSDLGQDRLDRRTRVHASEFVQEFGGEDLLGHARILRQADTLLEPRLSRSVAIWRELLIYF
jgi:hypothetical protein